MASTSAPLQSKGLVLGQIADFECEQYKIWTHSCLFWPEKGIRNYQTSLSSSRPIVCHAAASIFFFLWTFSTLPVFPFSCLSLSCSISLFFFSYLHHCPVSFYLASWHPAVATCALWLSLLLSPPHPHLADVAHHRAKHALNKPSNPKTPQGTILSLPLS